MRSLCIALLVCTLASTLVLAETRAPIRITSNDAFTEENGVVRGSGTEDDPFRISGWEIDVPAGGEYGIRIRGTTAHFVIEGCRVSGALVPEGAAILLEDVRNGEISSTTVRNSRHGLVISMSQGVTVANTYLFVQGIGLRVTGMQAEHYDHTIGTTNTINGEPIHYFYGLDGEVLEGIEGAHITVAGSRDVTLRGAKVERGDGITVAHSERTIIEGADLFRNRGAGVLVVSSPRTVIRDCERIANNEREGVYIWLSDRSQVLRTGLYVNPTGVHVAASDRVVLEDNVHLGNPVGVWVDGGSREIEIRRDLFRSSTYGVLLESAYGPTVHACAFSDVEIGVAVERGVSHAVVRASTVVDAGVGLSISGSNGRFEGNLITHANRGIEFPEQYGVGVVTGNSMRGNVFYRCAEGVYLARDTRENWIYENLFWNLGRAARDNGDNNWAPQGRGNWYSDYAGDDTDGDGIGDQPVDVGGGRTDPAPLVDRGFLKGIPGLLGTLSSRELEITDTDGRTAQLDALDADRAHARFVGFQGLPPELAENLALLFDWGRDVEASFHMQNVFLNLDLLFLTSDGSVLDLQTMEPDAEERYSIDRPFRFALEVPTGTLERLGLGEPTRIGW